jgi:hypothetical protein
VDIFSFSSIPAFSCHVIILCSLSGRPSITLLRPWKDPKLTVADRDSLPKASKGTRYVFRGSCTRIFKTQDGVTSCSVLFLNITCVTKEEVHVIKQIIQDIEIYVETLYVCSDLSIVAFISVYCKKSQLRFVSLNWTRMVCKRWTMQSKYYLLHTLFIHSFSGLWRRLQI